MNQDNVSKMQLADNAFFAENDIDTYEEEIKPIKKEKDTEKLMANFTSLLKNTDAKFTRKVNGIDRRVKRILPYGDVINDIHDNQIEILENQAYMQYLLKWIYLAILIAINFFIYFSIIFTSSLVCDGIIDKIIAESIFYSIMSSSILCAFVVYCCFWCANSCYEI